MKIRHGAHCFYLNQNLQAANFGTITSLAPGASGRIIQLGLRYAFKHPHRRGGFHSQRLAASLTVFRAIIVIVT